MEAQLKARQQGPIDWSQAGALIEAVNSASARQFVTGTSNWAAAICRKMVSLNHARQLVPADASGGCIQALEEKIAQQQPKLTVRLVSFPESNGKRNWTAMFVRVDPWDGLIGNAGGITIAWGEFWNRVAYAAERARFLLGERDTEPFILDYGDDIETPEQWKGESRQPHRARNGGA